MNLSSKRSATILRDLQLKIINRPLSALKPNPKNPRIHPEKQLKQLEKSIGNFGFTTAVLINKDFEIVAGHGRCEAARRLGYNEVPTILLEHLSPARQKAYLLADNRLAENAIWDDALLDEHFKELSKLNLDFSLELTGFDMGEIDFRIESIAQQSQEISTREEERIPQPAGTPASQRGDVWQLDHHRLICGSALNRPDYEALCGDEKAKAVITDPPYNVRIGGNVSGLGEQKHREFSMASGEMSPAEFEAFLKKTFEEHVAFSFAGSLHYYYMDWRHLKEILAAGEAIFGNLINLCVWAKTNGGMGSLYRSQHELVLVYRNGETQHRNNIQLGKYGRNRTNVWHYDGMNSFGRKNEEGDLLSLHPTVKPVAMIADAILDCTERGDIVLDSFLGSGSTLIAAEKVGRRCYGIELDPLYVDTAIRRWEAFTKRKAIHCASSLPFEELASRRMGDGR